jgi:hypothetical protein
VRSSSGSGARASSASAERLRVVVVERRLEGRGEDVRVEDPRVRVVEDRRLDAPRAERSGSRRRTGRARPRSRRGSRARSAAPGAAPLLPQRGDRAREADRDRAVEEADVDPELERVGRRHAEQLALDEATLDLPPLRGV